MKNRKKLIIIIGIIVLVILLGLIVYFLISGDNQKDMKYTCSIINEYDQFDSTDIVYVTRKDKKVYRQQVTVVNYEHKNIYAYDTMKYDIIDKNNVKFDDDHYKITINNDEIEVDNKLKDLINYLKENGYTCKKDA